MFTMSLPWWEFVLRGFVIYFFMLLIIRISGRKQLGQLSPFDFVLLLIVSNAIQNSMNGGDNSLIGGIISATSLFAINWTISYFNSRNKIFSNLVEGQPEIFISNGKIHQDILNKNNITNDDLKAIFRKNNVIQASDIRYGVLEINGDISIIKK